MSEPVRLFSERAYERQVDLERKQAAGQRIIWSDLFGICEPNPDLPDCQSWDDSRDYQCQLPSHHDGPHRVVIEWEVPSE